MGTQPNIPAPAPPKPLVDILLTIDLLGTPDATVLAAFHGAMTARNWQITLTADNGQQFPLPGGTYSGQTSDSLDGLSQYIHDWIVNEIWQEGAIVLVNEVGAWSIAGNQ